MVSASAESVPVQTSRPSAEDCAAVVYSSQMLMERLEFVKDITLDEFETKMDGLLTSPELINCQEHSQTVAHRAVMALSIEGAKWAVSKGVDLTVKMDGELTAYVLAKDLADFIAHTTTGKWHDPNKRREDVEIANQLATILKPPPAPATRTCAEVDRQTPPANEYCIVAENVQSSVEKDINFIIKGLTGLDEFHTIHSGLSGTGLYQGWTAEFTFTCSALSQGCGESNYNFEHLDKRHSQSLRDRIRKDYGFGVFCGDSGNLLDAKEVEAGESVSFTHSSDTERSSPWYQACSANSAGPFTLSIKTTRLAR